VMQQPKRADLLVLKELVEAGQLRPWIDGRYPLDKLPDAVRRLEARQVKGKLAIEI
jgi:NADPH:quinone reductase-like Zn-dependent oxidoreductase